ncbi:hypothetical protein JCM21714_4578 [Gracilibacillus boraciitolerans JCM 21714]|uniref:Uncharacterized protein n=1 Tax=Gracilibacillus boraciitolerans JCM 21714 TaxID=1298598 RepID=W4VQ59_9BACI|nr:hypothetical protein [Gracilibacillus boraciitolerans]GAE95352.1 hypothetical protein JCM21714_4578 [Gracilibacillus boraciitolerans JCM 21714]
MKNVYTKKVILLIIVAMIVTLFPKYQVKAEEVSALVDIEEKLAIELEKENISIENLEISPEELVLETSLETVEGDSVKATIEVEPGSDTINLFTEEPNELGDLFQKNML